MNPKLKTFINGFLRENPLLVLNIGLCSSLGVTTSIFNGIGLGIGMTFVLVMSEIVISCFRKLIPSAIRLPIFITVIAAFTTIVQLVLNAYVESLYNALGVFIPLIVVNCIIMGSSRGRRRSQWRKGRLRWSLHRRFRVRRRPRRESAWSP